MKRLCHIIILLYLLQSCSGGIKENPVKYVDLKKYTGVWYEIARLPNSFQKGCDCTTAQYELMESGYISVTNSCIKKGKLIVATGKAFVVEGSGNSQLMVQFQWPFKGSYNIVELDSSYNYAVVSSSGYKYLWILSRSSIMNDSLYNAIGQRLQYIGVNTAILIKNIKQCK